MKHIQLTGFTSKVEDDTVYLYYLHNDNGYLYVSYEDINIYTTLMGIVDSTDEIDYDYIYQYNEYGYDYGIALYTDAIYLANVFEKETENTEYLTQVAINVLETSTCTVYINPDGTSTDPDDLVLVPLEAGDSETIDAGYHTLEFAYPVELTGENFVVVIKQDSYENSSSTSICLESTVSGTAWENVDISEKCYYTSESGFSSNVWYNLGTLSSTYSSLSNSDSSIKAFTVTEYDGETLDVNSTEDTDTNSGEEEENTDADSDTEGDTSDTEDNDSGSQDTSDTENNTSDSEDNSGTTDETSSEPINSNFATSSCIINSLKYYSFSDDTEEYTTINVTIEDVTRYTSDNDSYEYYYYLSDSQAETDIENWIEITEDQTSSDSLTFNIDITELSNYSDLLSAENLYLYIKEVAIKDESTSTLITDAFLITIYTGTDIEIEFYLDGKMYYSTTINYTNETDTTESATTTTGTSTSNSASSTTSDDSDNTTSTTTLPYTRKKHTYNNWTCNCFCCNWNSMS